MYLLRNRGLFSKPLVEVVVDYLIVAGGGGAGGTGNNASPGGDAGQVLSGSATLSQSAIFVGEGGLSGPDWSSSISSTSGGASGIDSIIATGGAGSPNTVCCPGNSFGGQGGTALSSANTTVTTTGAVTPGISNSITGSSVRYGDSHWRFTLDQTPPHQPSNTGHGGWGVWSNANRRGGNGGSGVVIIRYPNTFQDILVGSGLQYRASNGTTQSGTGVRVAPSYTPTGFKVYQFNGGTGNIQF